MRIAVVGCGIFGLAAALELRERGHDVTAFDQGPIPNPKAASFDTSKTIRRVYGADRIYVDMVERAAPNWRSWQERSGARFFHEVGYIYVVRNFEPGKRVHDAWQLLSRMGRAEVTLVPLDAARERFPQFAFREGDTVLHDRWGGYLAADDATAAVAKLAAEAGVQLRASTAVESVAESGGGVEVASPSRAQRFDRAVIAAGVWLERLIPALGRKVRVTRQFMAFFSPPDAVRYAPGPMPVYSIESDTLGWYGHPLAREGWVKVANDLRGEVVDPDTHRGATPAYEEQARAFVHERIPGLADAPIVGSRSCLYDNTPDHDFVIDWAPGTSRVLVAGGGSGHGFKFGGSIGAVIADALEERANPFGDRFRVGGRFA